jgi:hypothetical protein
MVEQLADYSFCKGKLTVLEGLVVVLARPFSAVVVVAAVLRTLAVLELALQAVKSAVLKYMESVAAGGPSMTIAA